MLDHRSARANATAMLLTLSRTAFIACAFYALVASGQTNTSDTTAQRDAAEKSVCIRNLKAIARAISAYERAHTNLPNWLSDLVPQYLSDVQVL